MKRRTGILRAYTLSFLIWHTSHNKYYVNEYSFIYIDVKRPNKTI